MPITLGTGRGPVPAVVVAGVVVVGAGAVVVGEVVVGVVVVGVGPLLNAKTTFAPAGTLAGFENPW